MRRMRNTILAIVCFGALVLAQQVVYQYDRAVDFSGFHTYKWVTIQGNPQISQITAANIVNLVNTALAEKGLTPVMGGQVPDLYVGFQASVAQQQQLNWFNSGGAWKGGFGSATTETFDAGTLVIDIYNPAQKQLIWRGTATNTLNPSSNAGKNNNNLQKAIEKLLKPFPPSVKK
jgi:Domain of unknown function (DUF4136)